MLGSEESARRTSCARLAVTDLGGGCFVGTSKEGRGGAAFRAVAWEEATYLGANKGIGQ